MTAFTAAVFGGVSSIAGALLGTLWFAFFGYFDANQILNTFLENGGPLYLLLIWPAGLISIVNLGRDSILRVIAQRRQIVVPSLFTDYDLGALERRLIPCVSRSHVGLATLPMATLGSAGPRTSPIGERRLHTADNYVRQNWCAVTAVVLRPPHQRYA